MSALVLLALALSLSAQVLGLAAVKRSATQAPPPPPPLPGSAAELPDRHGHDGADLVPVGAPAVSTALRQQRQAVYWASGPLPRSPERN